MYQTCVTCNRTLGTNDWLRSLAVGRRVAFDPDRGRVWAICEHCNAWNLAPIEERWDAAAECQQLFNQAERTVADGRVGLARLSEDFELIKVGTKDEYVKWRYVAAQVGVRKPPVAFVLIAALTLGGLILSGNLMVLLALALTAVAIRAAITHVLPRQVLARFRLAGGHTVTIRRKHWPQLRLSEGSNSEGFVLNVVADEGTAVLTGLDALVLLRILLRRTDSVPSNPEQVQVALEVLRRAPDAKTFISSIAVKSTSAPTDSAAGHPHGERWDGSLSTMERFQRLALRIAVDEELERTVAEGELSPLIKDSSHAAAIADIADRLLSPEPVTGCQNRLREASVKKLNRGC